jgi:antitoxin CcdA
MSSLTSVRNAPKRATNVTITESLLSEAKSLSINVSHAAEAGLAQAIKNKQKELWLEENTDAINSSNLFVEKHGLPLEKYRMF